MKQQIDTIIFDLGGVLVDWKPEYVYRKAFNGDEEKVQWFLKNVCTPDWNMEQDAGRTIAKGNAVKIAEFPEYEHYIKLFYGEWTDMLSGAIEENLQLFKQLKASGNYKIYALTNWSAEKWDIAVQLFPFFNDFDGVVVSGIEKTRKPYPQIYNILLNRFAITPEKSIFIDDNKDNILASKALKINGIHFQNHQQLIEDLKAFQLNY
ncbi:HAD family phosphatase [Lutibacter sp. HS1-25]|uniref:HAD family hydrolase n=1 Tax=Lutibacter sp. HS1-25 TaxID=2485000 RepID=UPI001013503F|nr:HAD family phosphatase [Lutibacter sp. HS1-25]RXP44840.1 HAD family phosphatase [Lutibacter sp. HS1-25]